ncbi:Inositol-3-phosphate synthase 1 [Thelohanellus kitauei]|uniref:inositol-3-phosphate synthase n=1 Tax=Thelohanellus kitauei TaxID=669202 RepID=A0A0C2MQG4_THEKT|nr:Inositol-3-phosphate synthase 1 [Thelohanellus kitauei]
MTSTTYKFTGPNVKYSSETIEADYLYTTTRVRQETGSDGSTEYVVEPVEHRLAISTSRHVPRLGLMLIGWGGNNGSTYTAITLANKHKLSWETKDGTFEPNYYGSIVKSSTMCLGLMAGSDGNDVKVCAPLGDVLPFVDPNDIEIGGWDISKASMVESMKRAKVIDLDLQRKLAPYMKDMHPKPSVFDPDYVSPSQIQRADNIIPGTLKQQVEQIRKDIRDFKSSKKVDKVIVMWMASTERYMDINLPTAKDSKELLKAIDKNDRSNVPPSVVFALASIEEGCTFINGSPQLTLVDSVIQLAEQKGVFVAGDDLKTGQTKVKSALVEFLIGSGIKPVAIVSYNHLGNNDGLNLDSQAQFRSKEISKSQAVDELINSNQALYKPGEKIDHCIVIKYIPFVEDSKRALDEYTSRICMNGLNTLMIYNTCEDSLLAVPVMFDLVLLSELFSRIKVKCCSHGDDSYHTFQTILSALGFLLKAPLTQKKEPLINGLAAQKRCIENLIRACLGIPPENNMYLEHKFNLACHFKNK